MKKYTLIFCLLLSGCAITRDYVDIKYKPHSISEPIPKADGIQVHVSVCDERTIKDRVGCKQSDGIEMASIVPNVHIPDLIRNSIEVELLQRGFTLSKGNKYVNVRVLKFYNKFNEGFFKADAESECILSVTVTDSFGNIRFTKTIIGQWKERCFLMGGSNAALSLEGALLDSVEKIVCDNNFIQSLID